MLWPFFYTSLSNPPFTSSFYPLPLMFSHTYSRLSHVSSYHPSSSWPSALLSLPSFPVLRVLATDLPIHFLSGGRYLIATSLTINQINNHRSLYIYSIFRMRSHHSQNWCASSMLAHCSIRQVGKREPHFTCIRKWNDIFTIRVLIFLRKLVQFYRSPRKTNHDDS